jgi:hypothetical protein
MSYNVFVVFVCMGSCTIYLLNIMIRNSPACSRGEKEY